MANRQLTLQLAVVIPLACFIFFYGLSRTSVGILPSLPPGSTALQAQPVYKWREFYDNRLHIPVPAPCEPKTVADVPISIILTIFDQADIIAEIVDTLLETTTGPYHLIAIFDNCSDNSYDVVRNSIEKHLAMHPLETNRAMQKGLTEYRAVVLTETYYEVRANNLGLRMATTNYSIITQDDMLLTDHGWDRRMLRPIRAYDDIIAVTARCAHNAASVNEQYGWTDLRGNCGHHDFDAEWTNTLVIRDTVNRGPLLVDNGKMKALNYLDEAFWPLNLDDHDLCLRAYQEFGWVCGLFPISVHARLEWSHRRKGQAVPPEVQASEGVNMRLLLKRHALYLDQTALGLNHNQEREVPIVD